MKIAFFVVLVMLSSSAKASYLSLGRLAATSIGDITESFVQSLRFELACDGKVPRSIVYGAPQYGFFRVQPTLQRCDHVQADIIPPGYDYPIKFWVEYQDKERRYLEERRFVSPVPEFIKSEVRAEVSHGELPAPFYLVDGAFVDRTLAGSGTSMTEERDRIIIAMIINRHGEIVWLRVPASGRKTFDSYAILHPLGQGRYGIMTAQKESYFEIVDYRGRVLSELNPRQQTLPYMIHHDFIMTSSYSMLTFSNQLAYIRDPRSPMQPLTFMGCTLVDVDLRTGVAQKKWSAFNHFNPITDPAWQKDGAMPGEFLANWDTPKATYDYTHANSLQHVKGEGYLISMKNVDRLAMVSEDFSRVLWTVGKQPNDTYRTTDVSFRHQHHATMLADRTILLVDNASDAKARIIWLELDDGENTAKIRKSYQPQPGIVAPTRGSAYIWDNQLVGFFVGKDGDHAVPSYIVAFDIHSEKELGRVSLTYGYKHIGYRATPIAEIGLENYLGNELFLGSH